MKYIKTQDAVGFTLCHDVTQIIKGVTKDALFRKGHVITVADIPILLSLGKEHVYIWEDDADMLHENDAAEILAKLCRNADMYVSEPKEGKIELFADMDGLLLVDTNRLRELNSFGEMMVAARFSGSFVKKGDKLCGTRIIPLMISRDKMAQVCNAIGERPLLELVSVRQKKFGIITTGNEVFYGRIEDTFTPVIIEKMTEYGCEMVAGVVLDDDHEKITCAINDMLGAGAELVLCTGGMSVDPDDKTPFAIRNAADNVVSYGAPMLPGAMFMLAYMDDGRAICGLPGCVMYTKRTIFDVVLPRLLADIPITADWLAELGNGGLCLECPDCQFPNCVFGMK
ncbi:MAG: molybdopterin-binding protein [Oscillospiraceae bacterium]|jgi:molybdenum cofactor synthesis domain-containing protein|nr:molybdopterin-binding protein [Oscillospiraceae bacterium]